MKKRILFTIVILILLIVLSGCVKVYTCPADYLTQPFAIDPPDYAVVDSLTPILNWGFPDVPYPINTSTSKCIPEEYSVVLVKGPFYNMNIGDTITGKLTSFTPLSDLQPGEAYKWVIWPKSEGEFGPPSTQRIFFTGELCEVADLQAPLPVMPYNGAEVAELLPVLAWEYPGECRPESYRVDLSIDPTFADTSLSGGTGNSNTRWMSAENLSDCTRYYWKVTPSIASTFGPVSQTFTFRTNLGGCGPDEGLPGATITGMVWEDLCFLTDGPLPFPLPLGCTPTSGGGASGNGILDPGEPGIYNVLVRIGSGDCPSTDKGVTFTDENGIYSFTGIPGDDYCVSIDALESATTLIPGGWTYPPSGSAGGSIASHEVTAPDGDSIFDVDFGWFYQFGSITSYSSVEGVVWDDQCSNTSEGSDAAAGIGCVKSYWGDIYADGVRQPAETGIAGVTVEAFRGNCGSTSPLVKIAETQTDDDGAYHFLLPLYGTWTDYCVSIKAADVSNSPLLIPGVWTYEHLPFANMHNWENVQIHGHEAFTLDWGWDYLEIPFIPYVPEVFDFPELDLPGDTYCYIGPGFNNRAFAQLSQGSQYSILGVDPTGAWYLINPEQDYIPPTDSRYTPTPVSFVRCWVPKRDVNTRGVLEGLGVFTGVRTPTPTPTPTPVPSTPCSVYMSRIPCLQAGCTWKWITDKLGYCLSQ